MQKTVIFSIILGIILLTAAVSSADFGTGRVEIQRYNLRNLTRNTGLAAQRIEVASGDEIEFFIGVLNTSDNIAPDVQLRIYLPFGLEIVAGSLRIGGTTSGANILSTGIPLGNLSAREQKDVTFKAIPGSTMNGFYDIQTQLSSGSRGSTTEFVWINVLPRTAFLNNSTPPPTTPTPTPIPVYSWTPTPYVIPTITPTPITVAKTTVTTKIVYVYAEREEMTIVKVGRNVTEGQEVPTKQINTHPGDELEFSIQLTSVSDKTITGIVIKDTLPEQIDYIFNSARMGQQLISDQVFREGLSIGTLKPKETKTYRYRARVLPAQYFEAGELELKNISEAKAVNANTVTDFASIFVKRGGLPVLGGLLSFTGFWIYMLILLVAMGLLFLIFWLQDKKRTKALAQSPS